MRSASARPNRRNLTGMHYLELFLDVIAEIFAAVAAALVTRRLAKPAPPARLAPGQAPAGAPPHWGSPGRFPSAEVAPRAPRFRGPLRGMAAEAGKARYAWELIAALSLT